MNETNKTRFSLSIHGPVACISPRAIRHNIQALRSRLSGDTAMAAVVKSDAYGHGIETVARAAMEEGCEFLAVSSLDEAVFLRNRGFEIGILVTGPSFPEEAPQAVALGIHLAVGNESLARALDCAARDQGRRALVHVKLDTGMGRYGFLCEGIDLMDLIEMLGGLKNLDIVGLMTHFSESEILGSEYTRRQHHLFTQALDRMKVAGISPRWVHAANSGGIIHFAEAIHSLVRTGIAMYGVHPGPDSVGKIDLEPAMSLRCRVADTRLLGTGASISYGRRFTTHLTRRMALVPVGYGNGYPRSASGRAHVAIKGRSAPIVGTISMNVIVVDITNHGKIDVGDPVLLFGRLGQDVLHVEEVAEAAGTIPYEILCNVGRCTPRIVLEEPEDGLNESERGDARPS